MSRLQHRCAAIACVALLSLTSSCATSHLFSWSSGEPSVYNQPAPGLTRSVLHTGGTFVAFPVTLTWDVATFPFQWLGGVHPYGADLSPEFQGR